MVKPNFSPAESDSILDGQCQMLLLFLLGWKLSLKSYLSTGTLCKGGEPFVVFLFRGDPLIKNGAIIVFALIWKGLCESKGKALAPEYEGQLFDPLVHYITSAIAPWSLVLNKPVNPEALYQFITQCVP